MKSKVTYKIIELEHFGKKLGIFTVRKIEKTGRLEISSKVYESNIKKDCENFIKEVK